MLAEFEKEYGYTLTAEDFIKGGRRSPGHDVPDADEARLDGFRAAVRAPPLPAS